MLTRLTFLCLLLLGSGCNSFVGGYAPCFKEDRSLFVLRNAELPYLWNALVLVHETGAARLALEDDRILITDDSGDRFVVALERTPQGFTVQGWQHHFQRETRLLLGRGGKLMLLDDRDYAAWVSGDPGWWDHPDRWTNSFRAQPLTKAQP